jgi:hypothetical protein
VSEIYLSDTEFGNVRDTYTEKADKIEADLQEYVDNVKSVIEEKNLQGRTADALMAFAEMAEESIKDELADIQFRHRAITSRFVDDLAEQDDTAF